MSVSMNSYANGSNQNCGNVITGRSSTRVAAPPGGTSSFSLGWGSDNITPAPVKENRRVRDPNQSSFSIGDVSTKAAITKTTVSQEHVFGAQSNNGCSSNKYANGSNQNCGNVLTERTTTRVVAPPGGYSQITFG